ncbi:SCO6745 family protein [Pseudonocardia spirodelae]|uniref:SalK n=1 Tax=Pseudonocardia spirodelae TaxID=3133431 RepID=A0ABU8T5B0_9PSEU
MDHAEAVRMFFAAAPEGVVVPGAVTGGAPARRLRDALEPIAMHDVWSSRVGKACEARGYDFFGAYVGGRGGPFGGQAPGALVAATFAVFEPGFVGSTWDSARALLDVEELQRLRDDETAASLREVLGDEAGSARLAEVAGALERAVDAVSGAGRPLFSALRARPRPSDPAGLLWRAADLVREHRGDGHVAACVAAGLDPVRMGILAELWVGYPLGEYSGTRAWPEEMATAGARRLAEQGLITSAGPDAELTGDGRRFRDGIEAATDSSQDDLLAALGAGDAGFDALVADLDRWSQACIDAGAFPPDVRKRAAG